MLAALIATKGRLAMSDLTIEVNRHKKSLDKLNEITSTFHQELRSLNKDPFDELEIDGDSLRLSLFGVQITSVPRPVAVDGKFSAAEYSFTAREGEEVIDLWKFYLASGGKTYRDSELQQEFLDFNDDRIVEHFGYFIHSALMESSVFLPASD